MKVVWSLESATVRQVYETLHKKRHFAYTVMTMMNILEQKGFLRKRQEDRAYIYSPAQPQKQVIGWLVRDFLNCSGCGEAVGLPTYAPERRTGRGHHPNRRQFHALTMKTLLVFMLGLAAYGQPAFEIATLKRSPPPEGDRININLGGVRNGMLTFANASLSDCLKFAYELASDSQLAGPDWIKSKEVRFDIVAQVPSDMPREQMLLRLQSLLAERLKLAVHHEQKEQPYLALTTAKSGQKLHEVAPTRAGGTGMSMLGHIAGTQMPMRTLALLISRFERQTVLDQTGLVGVYEVKLEWTPDLNRPLQTDSDAPPGPSIFTAVREQLGLKLEPSKGAVDVLVVDHAEQVPADN